MHNTLPPTIAQHIAGYAWEKDSMGMSLNAVYRLTKDSTTLYLKTASPEGAPELAGEVARIRWLGDHLPVPDVVDFVIDDSGAYLLMTAVPGKMATSKVSIADFETNA